MDIAAAIAISGDAPFYRLPAEMLALIAEHLFALTNNKKHRWTGRHNLGSLRLTHPSFAYLRPLLAIMFVDIVIRPDPNKDSRMDWSKINQHIKGVDFRSASHIDGSNSDEAGPSFSHGNSYNEVDSLRGGVVSQLLQLSDCISVSIATVRTGSDRRRYFQPQDLMPFAVQCVTEANMQPHILHLSDYMDDKSRFWLPRHARSQLLPRWQLPDGHSLDLSRLTKLDITDQGFDYPDSAELAVSIVATLHKCSATLIDLNIWSNTVRLWPEESELPSMPRLECIDLSYCTIVPGKLGSWLSRCCSLQDFRISWTPVESDLNHDMDWNPVSDLRPIFDAIRSHPSRMVVWIDYIEIANPLSTMNPRAHPTQGLYLDHNTVGAPDVDQSIEDAKEWRPKAGGAAKNSALELVTMLKNYISKIGDWFCPDGMNASHF